MLQTSSALAEPTKSTPEERLAGDFGPVFRWILRPYFNPVRFPPEAEGLLQKLSSEGFVVHVMRTTAWVNFLYLTWALLHRGLPPVRAVVNLRRWFTRPWRKTAQRGEFEVRFTYARRHGGSGLIFLRESALGQARGKSHREDPFPSLVAMARKSDRPFFLVPELFAWEKWSTRLKPGLIDFVFGSPDAPGFLHTLFAFWRNYERAQFRVGEPIDLKKFIAENPDDDDERIARKIRGALHHHLAMETRAVFGPPYKHPERVIDETLRDRVLRATLQELADKRSLQSVTRYARKNLGQIAARFHPSVVALASPTLDAVFNRIYDGIEVDEPGLERAMRVASRAPIVLCPSHKSHVDYLVLSWVLWNRGYTVPLVAAGANLSFFPLGWFLRRAGAFFLRRSFKDDKIYGASFKAYVKKLVHDGVMQEFFPEGGRSRTGKLLSPKLGMFTWQVDAVLEGARNDLFFVPVSIDYEKIVESRSYSNELAGGEKKPEDLTALLKAPKVLASNYGRIHLTFDEPISLAEFMRGRGLSAAAPIEDDPKRALIRALGHRVMYGISRVSTITPQALVSASLLAHRRRGVTSRELTDRIQFLRRTAEDEQVPLSTTLRDSPSDPTVMGAVQEAIRVFCSDGMVRTEKVKDEVIYQPKDERRTELSFYKNTLMNLMAPRSLVAVALLASGHKPATSLVKDRALFLSRLFKMEFIYKVGASFDALFEEAVDRLERQGILIESDGTLDVAPEPHSRPMLEFTADLLRDYLESYLLVTMGLRELSLKPLDRKAFVREVLETGRAEFLAGRIGAAESTSRANLENGLAFLLDQKLVVEEGKVLKLGPALSEPGAIDQQVERLRTFLKRD